MSGGTAQRRFFGVLRWCQDADSDSAYSITHGVPLLILILFVTLRAPALMSGGPLKEPEVLCKDPVVL